MTYNHRYLSEKDYLLVGGLYAYAPYRPQISGGQSVTARVVFF